MEINKIDFEDLSVELSCPIAVDDLRTDFYSTERNKLIAQLNFLKSVVRKLCITYGNTVFVKQTTPIVFTNEMAEMLKSGELEFVNDTDFVKISDKTLVL